MIKNARYLSVTQGLSDVAIYDRDNHLGWASSPAVRQYLRTAEDYGLSATGLLQKANIDPDLLSLGMQRITGESFQTLIRIIRLETGDPLLGLKSSRYVHPGSYSIMGYIVMNCTTMQEAMEITPAYEQLVGDMGVTHFEKTADGAAMIWRCQYRDPLIRPIMMNNVLGSWVRFARYLVGKENHTPVRICFSHEDPGAEFHQDFQELFRCPVEFNADRTCLVTNQETNALQIQQPADPELRQTLEMHAMKLMSESPRQNVTREVLSLLEKMLPYGPVNQEKIARQLGISTKTLQRKLLQEDTGYQQLLDRYRRETAMHKLRHTNMSVQNIADLLGFSEPRSLSRKFREWTGKTPGEVRKEMGVSSEA